MKYLIILNIILCLIVLCINVKLFLLMRIKGYENEKQDKIIGYIGQIPLTKNPKPKSRIDIKK